MMASYLPLEKFKAIYVVDLCGPLCEQAKLKVAAKGWKNVHVVEGDACAFVPPTGTADLVTFSYSLSSEWLSGGDVLDLRASCKKMGGVVLAAAAAPAAVAVVVKAVPIGCVEPKRVPCSPVGQ